MRQTTFASVLFAIAAAGCASDSKLAGTGHAGQGKGEKKQVKQETEAAPADSVHIELDKPTTLPPLDSAANAAGEKDAAAYKAVTVPSTDPSADQTRLAISCSGAGTVPGAELYVTLRRADTAVVIAQAHADLADCGTVRVRLEALPPPGSYVLEGVIFVEGGVAYSGHSAAFSVANGKLGGDSSLDLEPGAKGLVAAPSASPAAPGDAVTTEAATPPGDAAASVETTGKDTETASPATPVLIASTDVPQAPPPAVTAAQLAAAAAVGIYGGFDDHGWNLYASDPKELTNGPYTRRVGMRFRAPLDCNGATGFAGTRLVRSSFLHNGLGHVFDYATSAPAGWNADGPTFCVLPQETAGTVALQKCIDPQYGNRLYYAGAGSCPASMQPIGIVGYVFPATDPTELTGDAASSVPQAQQCTLFDAALKHVRRGEIDAALMRRFPGSDTQGGAGCFQFSAEVATLTCNTLGYRRAVNVDGGGYASARDNFVYLYDGSTFVYWNAHDANQWCLNAVLCQGIIDTPCR